MTGESVHPLFMPLNTTYTICSYGNLKMNSLTVNHLKCYLYLQQFTYLLVNSKLAKVYSF